MSSEAKPDWRIGLSCIPKMRTHPLFFEEGTIVETWPSGTGGIACPAGVLKIKLSGGAVILAAADDWKTA